MILELRSKNSLKILLKLEQKRGFGILQKRTKKLLWRLCTKNNKRKTKYYSKCQKDNISKNNRKNFIVNFLQKGILETELAADSPAARRT